ncbi:MAG: PEP-CTERM sorting domain-containing protein, partial [Limisphaerales bacterium]
MKKLSLLFTGTLALAVVQSASAQYNESWENTVDGWGPIGGNMVINGFSTTLGVTAGSYSLVLGDNAASIAASSGPNYAGQIGSTASTALTLDLANAASVTLDVYVPGGNFGYYLQWDLALNQNGGLGYQSVDGYSYSQTANIGGEKTLTWTIPSAMQAILAANPTLPTSLNFQIGGGFSSANDAVYLDNLTITEVPEPTTLVLAGLGALGLLAIRRR